MKIGLIGTGMLGNAIGIHLLHSGYQLTVFNRTSDKTIELEKNGACVVSTPKEVGENSDIVIIVVKDANAVNHVSFEKDGIVYGNHKGLIVCDMSTINPINSKNNAEKFSNHDISMLDTPVMGGPNVAINGELIMMASGNKNTFDSCKKLLDTIATKVFFLGESGTAHSIKLAMNLQITMLALAISEGITLTRGMNINPETFLEILNSTYFKTGMSENKAFKMIQDNFEPTFTLENLKKDINTISQASKSLGLELPMTKKAEEVYENAVKEGFGKLDYTGILAYLKKINKMV
ncbi:MAG: NAD(P)-dependent oxidoreductase [Nitrosopumilus sp.]|nr:NAD(P)-dependent oxidoreductase [Nitrosopumilus sp.]